MYGIMQGASTDAQRVSNEKHDASLKDYGTFCIICQKNYNFEIIPHVLKCGHTFCSLCIEKSKSQYIPQSGFAQSFPSSQSRSNNTYVCFVCRKNDTEAPSKNYSLIELLNDDNYEAAKSKKIGYCADHDAVLSLEALYEHKDHDWFLIGHKRAQEIVEKKSNLLIENSLLIEKEIEDICTAQKDILIIKEKNSHFNRKIDKLNEIKNKLIKEIEDKTLKCLDELAKLSSVKVLDNINQSLKHRLKLVIESQTNFKKMLESFHCSSVATKLCYQNKKITAISLDHYIDRGKYIRQELEELDYLESINCGHLIFENRSIYYGE